MFTLRSGYRPLPILFVAVNGNALVDGASYTPLLSRRHPMAIFLNDAEVTSLLSTPECVDILDDLFKQEAEGKVENLARRRARLARGVLMEMGGVVLGSGVAGVRFYGAGGKNLTTILKAEGGEVEAVLGTPNLRALRTGAASVA